jgi:hypothetical protein
MALMTFSASNPAPFIWHPLHLIKKKKKPTNLTIFAQYFTFQMA